MLREYFVRIKIRNRKIDFNNLEYTISKFMGLSMKDVEVVKEIEYFNGGCNVKSIQE